MLYLLRHHENNEIRRHNEQRQKNIKDKILHPFGLVLLFVLRIMDADSVASSDLTPTACRSSHGFSCRRIELLGILVVAIHFWIGIPELLVVVVGIVVVAIVAHDEKKTALNV